MWSPNPATSARCVPAHLTLPCPAPPRIAPHTSQADPPLPAHHRPAKAQASLLAAGAGILDDESTRIHSSDWVVLILVQEVVEAGVVGVFEDAMLCAVHAKRVTVM
jgi:hypothetical protein